MALNVTFGPLKTGYVTAAAAAAQEKNILQRAVESRLQGRPAQQTTRAAPAREWQQSVSPLRTVEGQGVSNLRYSPARSTLADNGRSFYQNPLQTPDGLYAITAPQREKQQEEFFRQNPKAAQTQLRAQDDAKKKATEEENARASRSRDRDSAFGSKVNVKQLSWDEYDALTPQERAAVDFNGALFDASEKDQAAGLKGSDDDYTQALRKVFGGNASADTYAPNTLALLDEIGYSDMGGSIDNFLKQGAAISTDDFAKLQGTGVLSKEAQDSADYRTRYVRDVANRTNTTLNDLLSKGQSLLQGMQETAQSYGSSAEQLPATPGWGDDHTDDFSQLFDYTSRADTDFTMDDLQSTADQSGFDLNDYLAYADSRMREYQQRSNRYGAVLGTDDSVTYASIPQLRSKLSEGN